MKGYIAAMMTFVGGYCVIVPNPRLLQSMEDCLGRSVSALRLGFGLKISMSPNLARVGGFEV